jgi:hypothetical protein
METPGESGWRVDPTGRHELRFWNGSRWTDHVADDGVTSVDSLTSWISTSQTTGPTAGATPSVHPRATIVATKEQPLLGEVFADGGQRPAVSAPGALAAGAGVLVSFAALAAAVDESGELTRGAAIVLEIVVLVLAYLAAFRSKFLLPAATASASIAIPILFGLLLFDPITEGRLKAFLVLTTVAWAVMLVAPGFRGRPWLLGLTLYGVVASVVYLTASNANTVILDEEEFDPSFTGTSSKLTLLFGAAYLITAAVLDREDRRGTATPFVAVGIVTTLSGAFGVVVDLDELGGIVLFGLVSLAVLAVGALGDRRASTWLGAGGITATGVALISQIVDDDPSGAVVAVLLLVVAGVMIAAGAWIAANRSPRSPQPEP